MEIKIIKVDYLDSRHGPDVGYLLNGYSQDPMGASKALPEHVKNNLAGELAKLPHAFSVISYVDNEPAGLINCFVGFSTFKCKPLVNIHDIYVDGEYRGLKLSHKMLDKVVEIAKSKGCCKLTLEVLEGNRVARSSYQKFGFSGYGLDPELGSASFWEMNLSED